MREGKGLGCASIGVPKVARISNMYFDSSGLVCGISEVTISLMESIEDPMTLADVKNSNICYE